MAKATKTAPELTAKSTGSKNKVTVTVVVNGESVAVEANLNAPLHTLIAKALAESGNVGQPSDNWELKDEGGTVLDSTKKVEDLGIAEGQKLFLSLKAGAAG